MSGKRRQVVACSWMACAAALVVAALGFPAMSQAAPSWSSGTPFTGAFSAFGALSDPLNRFHTVTVTDTNLQWQTFGAGGVPGAAQAFPVVGNGSQAGTQGPVAWMADGSALVSWSIAAGGGFLIWRSPSGAWGPNILNIGSLPAGLAAQPGEGLVLNAVQHTVRSVSIAGDGTLAFGAAADLDPTAGLEVPNTGGVALDPDGSAVAIYKIGRTIRKSLRAGGVWTTSTVDEVTAPGTMALPSAANTPGGRLVAVWLAQEGATDSPQDSRTIRAVAREPGADLSPARVMESLPAGGDSRRSGRYAAAAGVDETLAVLSHVERCTGGANEGPTHVLVVGPGQSIDSAGSTVIDALATAGDSSPLFDDGPDTTYAFAANGTRALVGIVRETFAGKNSSDTGRACGPGGAVAPFSIARDSLAIVVGEGGDTTTLSTTTYSSGTLPPESYVQPLSAALDGAGDGLMLEHHNTNSSTVTNPTRFSRGTLGGAAPGPGPGPGPSPDPDGSPGPVVTPPVINPPLSPLTARVKFRGERPTRRGVSITFEVPKSAEDHAITISILLAYGRLKASASEAAAAKPVTLGKASKTVRKAGKATITVRYTKAGRKLLAKRKKLKATLRTTTKSAGLRARVVDRKLKLRQK